MISLPDSVSGEVPSSVPVLWFCGQNCHALGCRQGLPQWLLLLPLAFLRIGVEKPRGKRAKPSGAMRQK